MKRSRIRDLIQILRWPIILGSVLLVGWMDQITGVEITVSFFYLAPVVAATWWFGRGFGLSAAFLGAATSWTMDWLSDFGLYRHPEIAALNALLRLGIFVAFAFTIDGLKRKMLELDRMATHDLYTGVLNSRGFYQAAAEALREARESESSVALSYIDLDHFKQVNDRFGHLEGDRLLKLVADEIQGLAAGHSLVARLGGDEFVILSKGLQLHELEKRLQEIRSRLNGRMQAEGWPVTFTIGAVLHETTPDSIDALIQEADALMYRGKKSGRNRLNIRSH